MKRRFSTVNRAAESAAAPATSGCAGAFTLVELLVVITILGVLAAIGLPKLSTFGQSNAVVSATRQLLDDIAFARARAISSRSDVYLVFVAPGIVNFPTNGLTPAESTLFNSLLGGQYTTYALFATRNVGDQPGSPTRRFLTSWKTLPPGTYIAAFKFNLATNQLTEGVWGFQSVTVPFPLATSTNTFVLPCIGFDYQGRVKTQRDEGIPLARGSIFPARDASGQFIAQPADVIDIPVNNWSTNSTMWNHVYIDWLTGRARVEHQEIQ